LRRSGHARPFHCGKVKGIEQPIAAGSINTAKTNGTDAPSGLANQPCGWNLCLSARVLSEAELHSASMQRKTLAADTAGSTG
jgi:hypothetical protein